MIAVVTFWFCVLAVAHSYVFYPLLLKVFSFGKKENSEIFSLHDSDLPQVFVIFSAFNEEKVIAEKLESVFNTSYPLGKIQVYVGSDNSTDNTNNIIENFSVQHSQLKFFPFANRNGKSNVMNKLVDEIGNKISDKKNSVFILTDANVMFARETIFELVKHFKNENIGQVGANILNRGQKQDGISVQESAYIQRENNIKYLEGLNWGSMIGAFGGCFALRAESWTPIPENFIVDDFYLSMQVLSQNKKAILERKAVCYEDVTNEIGSEFNRKARIQAGNFQNLAAYWKILFRFDAVAFCFFSHKVIRWLGPALMILSYIANLFLLPRGHFYQFTFVAQNLLLLSPVFDWLLKRANIHLTLLRFASYFIMMNIALAKGFWMFAKGIETNVWNRTERNI